MARVRVKVCCISSAEEARLAINAGADAIGLVGEMPSGPGVIDDALIAEITRQIPPPVTPVLLTSRTDGAGIAHHAAVCGVSTVQIVDHIGRDEHQRARRALPGLRLLQVIHVTGAETLDLVRAYGEVADALLLDSGSLAGEVKELGGTGRVHDWSVSRHIVEVSPVPVFLAGGLHADNVAEAIRHVRPFGVDLCSGVRRQDALDPGRLAAFFDAVATA
ncbi:MAG: phosphoribosylanthranilate isomerase [Rhodospirillales bacterium]